HAFANYRTEVYCEKKVTGWKGLGVIVVDDRSADPGIPGVVPIPLDEDHLSICKPTSRQSLLYRRVLRFVKECLPLKHSLIPLQTRSVDVIETPTTKQPEKQLGDPVRLALVQQLSRLAPADWATLVTAIKGAGFHISRQGSVAEQVAELIRWSET